MIVMMLVAGLATAADPPEANTGIKVGQKAPDFKLKDQTGTERQLAVLLRDGPVALVFYRSANW